MGCGVSKEDIAEPSRVQQVVVRPGSPTKSHEAAAQNAVNTTPVTQGSTNDTVNATPPTSPVSTASAKFLPPPTPAPATPLPVAPAADSPDHAVPDATPVLPFPSPTSKGDKWTCEKSAEAKPSAVGAARTSNGLVGTLTSLEEILKAQETVSINSKLRVTADKVASYGGVLRSLENTVELQAAAEEQQQIPDTEPQEQEAAAEARSVLSVMSPVGSSSDGPVSPATQPSIESARKKLPPLATPLSFMIDKGTDPFVKAPLPMQLLKSQTTPTTHDIPVSPVDLTSQVLALPPSPPYSPTAETEATEHLKDITVVNGAPGFDHENCSSPQEWTSLQDLHSEDVELENIILLETLEIGDSTDGDYGSRVNHINHNIRVTSLTSELGASSNGQHSPYCTSR